MSTEIRSTVTNLKYQRLRNVYEQQREIFDAILDRGQWTPRSVGVPERESQSFVHKLTAAATIEVVREIHTKRSNRYITVYRLTDVADEYLREYRDERPTLPCGCRAHVHHADDGYGCQYCGADGFDRAQVEQAMAARGER